MEAKLAQEWLTSGNAGFQTQVCPVSRMTLKTGPLQSDKAMREIQNSIRYHCNICKSGMISTGEKFIKNFSGFHQVQRF